MWANIVKSGKTDVKPVVVKREMTERERLTEEYNRLVRELMKEKVREPRKDF